MEHLQQITQTLALTLGSAWASGINLYATICILGIASHQGALQLPAELQLVQEPVC